LTAGYLQLISGQRRGAKAVALRGLLRLASWPYVWGVGFRNRLFDWGWKQSVAAPVPVISVGNLTMGGTGKTPCVEYVARSLRDNNWRVAILSRGYAADGGPNDEALVLEENLPEVPHLQGADRVALAATAVEELDSEVLILDDGFQHRRLRRVLDIVLIDATQPWGFGYSCPRGLLRESRGELRRANVVVLTRCDQVPAEQKQHVWNELHRIAPAIPRIESRHRPASWLQEENPSRPLATVKGPAAAFCGIGNPDAFRKTLEAIGVTVREFRTFADHYAYRRTDVEDLEEWAGGLPNEWPILTTQKDLVKLRLPRLGGKDLLALRIGLQIEKGEEEFQQLLIKAVTPLAA